VSALLPWAWLFPLAGLVLTGLGVGARPGAASLGGPALMLVVALGWLFGPRAPVEVVGQGWLPFLPNGAFHLRGDALAAVMLAVVGAVSLCVYVYSLAYMADETPASRRRFFAFLDFFVASMAILVLAGNLAVLLVGWAGVGMASFLLISFWHDRPGTLGAGVQALAANAIGDAALLLAIVLLPTGCGDLLTLQAPACLAGPGGAGLLATLILVAASAKSAQGPLYFWIPSAMAGPTPVSALIHAATMVAAGVYLLVRTHSLIEAAPQVAFVTALIGVLTAIGGGLGSIAQQNFKRGLAYSTVSQLGYMFAAVGFGAPFAALFHLITHASFKALLFLAAGVVIHARHGHEELAALGGLRRALPGAYAAFLVGSLSLIGVPLLTAGAFSKDAILEAGERANFFAFLCLGGAVGLTGYYIGRLFFGVFHGPRPDDEPLHEPSPVLLWPLLPLAIGAVALGYLEWPSGLISSLLGATVGHAEPVHAVTPAGVSAAALGLAGFGLAGWQRQERAAAPAPAPAAPGGGWVDALAGVGVGLSDRLTAVHSGRLGRYALVSVLGIGLVLLVGLLSSSVGIVGARP
jgi:NADH-quinone oxidoreductase subunit L